MSLRQGCDIPCRSRNLRPDGDAIAHVARRCLPFVRQRQAGRLYTFVLTFSLSSPEDCAIILIGIVIINLLVGGHADMMCCQVFARVNIHKEISFNGGVVKPFVAPFHDSGYISL